MLDKINDVDRFTLEASKKYMHRYKIKFKEQKENENECKMLPVIILKSPSTTKS